MLREVSFVQRWSLTEGNSRSYTPQPSVFKGVQACRLPGLKRFQRSRRPFGHSILLFRAFIKPFQRFRRPFQGNSRSYTPQPSVFTGVQACRLPGLKRFQRFRRPFQGNSRSYTPQPSVFKGVQACRLPGLKRFQRSRKPFQGNSRSYTPQPSVFKGVQACRLPGIKRFQRFRRPFQGNSRSYTPQPSVFKGVPACRLPGIKRFQRSRRPFGHSILLFRAFIKPFQRFLFLRAFQPAVCPASNASNASAGLSKATLAATRPSHLFLRAFKPAVCLASNASNAPAGLSKATLAATRPSHLFLRAFKPAVGPASSPSNTSAGLSKATLQGATRPSHLFLRAFKPAVCPASNASNASDSRSYTPQPSVFKGVQACRWPGLKPFQHFRRPVQSNSTRSYTYSSGNKSLCFTVSHRLSVLARAISFSCVVSQRACHAWRECPRTNGMTTQQFHIPGTSGHGAASLCWHGPPSWPSSNGPLIPTPGRPWKGVGGTRALAHSIPGDSRRGNQQPSTTMGKFDHTYSLWPLHWYLPTTMYLQFTVRNIATFCVSWEYSNISNIHIVLIIIPIVCV